VPRLAIVIPAVGTIESLEGTLVSVLENRPTDCEIIVALNRPYADPYDLKGEVRFVEPARGSTVKAIRRALAETRAPFVHLLASGCQVTEGWADEALQRFGDRQVGSVAPLVMQASEPEQIFAAGVGYHRSGRRFRVGEGLPQVTFEMKSQIVGPCAFAAFYRKSALDFVGGFSSQLTLTQADVDLAFTLRHAGFNVATEPRSRILATAAADPQANAFSRALADERLFWRNLDATGRVGALAGHAALVAAEAIRNAVHPRGMIQLAARAWGLLQMSRYSRHRRALAELEARAIGSKADYPHLRIDRSHGATAPTETTKSRVSTR